MRRIVGATMAAAALVAAVVILAWGLGTVELPGEDVHDRATVTITEPDGAHLATVDARVADSRRERIRGLGETDSLANGTGMLFVHPWTGTHSYVMRDVAVPLDIVFVAPCEADCPPAVDGRVTVVHEADVPPPGEDSPTYTGRGKWVLEVPQGYTDATGVTPGDHVRIRFDDADGE